MAKDNHQADNGRQALAQAVEAGLEHEKISFDLVLRQRVEQLILTAPDRACAVLGQYGEAFAKLDSSKELGSLLGHTLLNRKLYDEAVEYVRLGFKWKWQTETSLLTGLGSALLRVGKDDLAREVLQLALAGDPSCTAAVKGLYECAQRVGRAADAAELLDRLAAMDKSYASLAFVYKERRKLSLASGREIRIALLSSYTLDWLIPYLDEECRIVGLCASFYQSPFNQYAQEILNPQSELYTFQPDIVFLALAAEDLFPLVTAAPNESELSQVGSAITEQVLQLVQVAESRSSATIVVHEFSIPDRAGYGLLDNRLPAGLSTWVASLNRNLAAELKKRKRTYLLPIESVISWVGKERSTSPKLTYMAGMRLAEPILGELARYYMRYIKPLKGLTRKCIVLDLDGTLWGGVVGELGPEGVSLGPTAPGIEYVDFQRALLGLSRRGILLALCSKNNPDDALAVIRNHPHMLLKEEHFASMRINWNNKADNIREIAEELNIGLDSMVFLDDNPNERELVKQLIPEVLTVELPKDASLYRRTIEAMNDFELLALTQEDQVRGAQYKANSNRLKAKSNARSLDEYLQSLNLQVAVGIAEGGALPRLVQLFNKTNQFNLTTRRYQMEEVSAFMALPDTSVYDLHVKDRFGDHGLVGTAVIRKDADIWRIDSFLMSCRVMGLGIETAFLDRICWDAKLGNVKKIVGEFIPTKKNHPVKEFYASHGFHLVEEKENHQTWALPLARCTINTPDWIKLAEEEVPRDR